MILLNVLTALVLSAPESSTMTSKRRPLTPPAAFTSSTAIWAPARHCAPRSAAGPVSGMWKAIGIGAPVACAAPPAAGLLAPAAPLAAGGAGAQPASQVLASPAADSPPRASKRRRVIAPGVWLCSHWRRSRSLIADLLTI